MPNEVLNALDKIAEITFQIAAVYEELTYLKVNESFLPDYEERLQQTTKKLSSLKQKEDELYTFFDEISYAIVALNYMVKSNTSPKETEMKCARRILKRLARINANFFINNPESTPEGQVDPENVKYLTNKGYTVEESTSAILNIALVVEQSIATSINNIHLSSLKDIVHDNIKALYFKRLFEQPLTIGGTFEEKLIANNFSYLDNNLKENIEAILPNDKSAAQHLINKLAEEALTTTLSVLFTSDSPEDLDEAFIHFKAQILHISSNELEHYKIIISFLSLVYHSNPDYLLKEIDAIITLRKKSKEK